jgi:hypothetical protein
MIVPKIKKKIRSFLTREDGKISKESLIKTGILLSAAAIASLNTVNAGCPPSNSDHNEHCNELHLAYGSRVASGTHEHGHGDHSSHSSHSSHNSYAFYFDEKE